MSLPYTNCLKGLKASDFYARMTNQIHTYRLDNRLVVRGRNYDIGVIQYGSLLSSDKVFGVPFYAQWLGRLDALADTWQAFGWERQHGDGFANGGISLSARWAGGVPVFETNTYDDAGNVESNVIAAVQWNLDTWFSVHREANRIRFWSDAVLVATHTVRIPTTTMPFFLETAHVAAPAVVGDVFAEINLNSVI